MNSIRIEKRDIYTIEVNDNGDTIEFDLLDIELPFRAERAMAKVNQVTSDLKAKLLIIDKRTDTEGKNFLTRNENDKLMAYKEAFKSMREAVDEFLGAGACQKIFGDRNYLEMYDELFKALAPHMEKMKITTDGVAERIKSKYSQNDDGVLR